MASQEFPVEFEELSQEEITLRTQHGHSNKELVRVNPGNIIFPGNFRHLGKFYYNFQFRNDDIALLTYPKSGTHWMYEVLWALKNVHQLHTAVEPESWDDTFFIDRDLVAPITTLKGTRVMERFSRACPGARVEDGIMIQLAQTYQHPRIISTHLQLHLLNPSLLDTCKVIYVARNPKDVYVSLYHHLVDMGDYEGDFPVFMESILNNEMIYGLYWDHIREAWDLRDNKNLHFMFYEDLKNHGIRELRKVSDFLNLDLTDDHLMKVAEHINFNTMKARYSKETVNDPLRRAFFLRKGQTGDWKNIASPELDARMNAWIKDNSHDLSITLKYE